MIDSSEIGLKPLRLDAALVAPASFNITSAVVSVPPMIARPPCTLRTNSADGVRDRRVRASARSANPSGYA